MTEKKIPQRRCLGCNQTKPKNELVRIVRDPDGNIAIDLTGKKSGRGAYVCRNPDCLKKLRKSGRLEKELSVSPPDEIWDELEKEMSGLA
jgi:hypothetical protein